MREIKFRGWDSEDKIMLNPQDLSQNDELWTWLGKKDVVLMQYTGLIDKNGKEIYEGDILQRETETGIEKNLYIQDLFQNGGFWMSHKMFGQVSGLIVSKQNFQFQIIGNIYENPELLEDPLESLERRMKEGKE